MFRSLLNLERVASQHISVRQNSFLGPLRKWAYNASGFNKYGLMHDDCLYEDEDVKEALRRIPEKVLHERNYRIVRAMQLAIQHDVLPKEQWTKYEEDVRYLSPIIEQVKKERDERETWEASH